MLTSGTFNGIRSIQYFSVTIGASYSSATATITSVNTAKSILSFLGTEQGGTFMSDNGAVTLTNATTVTATRVGSTNPCTIRCCVVEYF